MQELLQGVYSQNIYGATDSNDLEFQAAGLLSPQQVAAHAAREAKAAAAANGAAGTPAAGAAAAGAAGGQQPAGAAGARQPAAGAAPAVKEEDDYDALLEQL